MLGLNLGRLGSIPGAPTPSVPVGALTEDDGTTLLYEDDGTTVLTED